VDQQLLDALTDGSDSQGYVKAGVLGFPKSGKTHTAALFACGVRKHFNLAGPVSFFDTEGGSVYVRPVVEHLSGVAMLAKRARNFDALMVWARACVKAGVSVGLVDSITHPWRELCDAYLAAQNDFRRSRGWQTKEKLEFQDWNVLKPKWAEWTDFYLNSPLHIIICGRAGWEYEMETNEKGKKELIKTGVKMKTESEFGFEPSLLWEMEREQRSADDHSMVRTATVIGDRFSVIDGKKAQFPSYDMSNPKQLEVAFNRVYEFFKPHLACLSRGAHATIDTGTKTGFDVGQDGESFEAEKRQRVIQCEEIQGELTRHYPGQTAAEKQAKMDLIEKFFGTRSWTKVEGMPSKQLRDAKDRMIASFAAEKTEQTREPGQEG